MSARRLRRRWRSEPTSAFLCWAAVFALAYTQAPLYSSNQNQYFLQGLADAGLGFLGEDWLANTRDPTPLFSLLISATYRFGNETLYYVWYGLLLGVYFFALSGVFRLLLGELATPLLQRCFALLFLTAHAGLVRLASGHLLGVDYPWYFQAGLAGQYILGPTFQPSVFGVLLLLSLYLFLVARPWAAAVSACLAATIHTTYLFSAACLILSYQVLLERDGRRLDAALLGGLSLLLVSPIVLYTWSVFQPSSPSAFAEAQQLLAHFRIPHHCVIDDWLDWIAALQCAWIVIAIWLLRGRSLAIVMLFSFVPGLALSVVQQITGSNTLALLFPWRVSVYLVPLSTTVVLAAVLKALAPALNRLPPPRQRALNAALLAGIFTLAAGGAWISVRKLAYAGGNQEPTLFAYVRATKTSADVYLVPFDLPSPRGRRGAFMRDFVPRPPPEDGEGRVRIALEQFRLRTGAPIFVDFKSIPYKDFEVLEWHRRVQIAQTIYRHLYAGEEAEAASSMQAESITHLVIPVEHVLRSDAFRKEFGDDTFAVYRIRERRVAIKPR